MANIAWRKDAKNILYNYPANQRYLRQLERELIYAQAPRREVRRRGGMADPTAFKGIQLDQGELGQLRRQQEAVERLLERLDAARRDAKYKRLLLEMVYFRRSHSLYGAAAYLGIPERTAHRWNAKMLYALAEELGYFDDSADDRPYLPRKTRL